MLGIGVKLGKNQSFMKVAAVVPAKSKSSRIPNKNLQVVGGDYLFRRKLRQLLACAQIDAVYLDTDSEQIATLVKGLDVRVINRPAHLADNNTDGNSLFEFEIEQMGEDFDIYCQALCTAPFLGHEKMSQAIRDLKASPDADSIFAGRNRTSYDWDPVENEASYNIEQIPNSVDLKPVFEEAMSFYAVKRGSINFPKLRIGKSPILFSVSNRESIDINTSEDLAMARAILRSDQMLEATQFQLFSHNFTSPILADVVRESNLGQASKQKLIPFSGGSVFGRARTLKLKPLGESDNWTGIYDGLDTYQFLGPGDLITVAAEGLDFAYFGELNSLLAVRQGVQGFISSGLIRDAQEIPKSFPVFAAGRTAFDAKYAGVVDSAFTPIDFLGMAVEDGDLLFCDEEGVVVIPEENWERVTQLAFAKLSDEIRVKEQIFHGLEAKQIREVAGDF
jgi:CMP-N-acetylneuraminic acid synthetase/regulator of RNase E activity RraA